jgi:isopropylmalate/homocitrate/citramalate synthase
MEDAMPKFPVFSPSETDAFQRAINQYRAPGAYEPGKWSVSPLARRRDVVGTFPERVVLRDIALRTTDQMPGVVLSPEDRLRFMRAIAETGVPSLLIGVCGRRGAEEVRAEVELIKAINPGCEIAYGGLRNRGDLEFAAKVGIDIVQFWAAPYVEAAPMYAGQGVYQKSWAGQDWKEVKVPMTQEAQIASALEFVKWGKELGVKTSAGINQLSFATEQYVESFCKTMHEAGAPEIVLYDGGSGMSPEGYEHMVRIAKKNAPNAVIGVHTHNMFDLAVACAVSAVKGGATVLEVSVNGYCSASGQADLAAAAATFEALYGVKTGIKLEKLTPLARLGEEITGYELAWNAPVTGKEVYNWGGTEFVIQELKVDPLVHWCIEPKIVGNERRWDITFDSGPYTMLDKLNALGVKVDLALVEPILAAVKDEMRKLKRVLTDDEVRKLASQAGRGELRQTGT